MHAVLCIGVSLFHYLFLFTFQLFPPDIVSLDLTFLSHCLSVSVYLDLEKKAVLCLYFIHPYIEFLFHYIVIFYILHTLYIRYIQ